VGGGGETFDLGLGARELALHTFTQCGNTNGVSNEEELQYNLEDIFIRARNAIAGFPISDLVYIIYVFREMLSRVVIAIVRQTQLMNIVRKGHTTGLGPDVELLRTLLLESLCDIHLEGRESTRCMSNFMFRNIYVAIIYQSEGILGIVFPSIINHSFHHQSRSITTIKLLDYA
jgi:hypothetical protein